METTVKPLVEAFLQERGLTLSPEKTVVTPISEGAGWVRRHYFHTVGNRHWVFSGTVPGPDGTPVTARLFAATSCRFQRHTKVQANANPFDPAWRAYFA